jgi:signal transduction histidine kinase
MGYAELLLMDDNLREDQRHYLQNILDAVQRMRALVSDLSDISRIESGHFYMAPTQVPVETVVQGVRDAVANQIRERQHTWVEEIAPDLPPMYVDYFRLLQVLTNLASNAYKYTPHGGTITLRASLLQRSDGPRIAFSVQDTGIGLNPESLAKLGTKFWRATDNFTRSQPGTGLGFVITRSLVEQMGDSIAIESAPERGSTFTFSVPVWQGQDA